MSTFIFQVINIVQECFNDLTLKLYAGLETVERKDEKDFEKLDVSKNGAETIERELSPVRHFPMTVATT